MSQGNKLPLEGQVLAIVDFAKVSDDYGNPTQTTEVRDGANVLTSKVDLPYTDVFGTTVHKPVLDIDLPMQLIPSSTPGHHHLIIDKAMTWEHYAELLRVLAKVGVIEEGYYQASLSRGFTCVRLPWIKKEAQA